MKLDLNPLQRDLLLHLVDAAIRDIGPEIRHTDSRSYKDDLKDNRRELRELHRLLAGPGGVGLPADSALPGLLGTP